MTPRVFFGKHMVTVLVKSWLDDGRDYWKAGRSEPSPSRLSLCASPRERVCLVTDEDLTWGGAAFAP